MSKLIFKPEDFDGTNGPTVRFYANNSSETFNQVAAKAQEVFDKWLSDQQVVYGYSNTTAWYPREDIIDFVGDPPKLKGFIVCVEEIKTKCEHKLAHLVIRHSNETQFYCSDCKKPLKTPVFEAENE